MTKRRPGVHDWQAEQRKDAAKKALAPASGTAETESPRDVTEEEYRARFEGAQNSRKAQETELDILTGYAGEADKEELLRNIRTLRPENPRRALDVLRTFEHIGDTYVKRLPKKGKHGESFKETGLKLTEMLAVISEDAAAACFLSVMGGQFSPDPLGIVSSTEDATVITLTQQQHEQISQAYRNTNNSSPLSKTTRESGTPLLP